MKIALLDALLRRNPAADEVDESLETILDIRSENLFLRKLVFFLGLSMTGLAAVLVLLAARADRPCPQQPSSAVWYTDQNSPNEVSDESSNRQGPAETDAKQEHGTDGPFHAGVAVLKKFFRGGSPPKRDSAAPSQPESEEAKERQAEGMRETTRGALWKLLETVSTHPRRQLLEKSYGRGGLEVTFLEASPDALFHFRMANATRRTLYLPTLQTVGPASDVHIERRVLEPGESAEGVLSLKEPLKGKTIRIAVSAANFRPQEFTLEVPAW